MGVRIVAPGSGSPPRDPQPAARPDGDRPAVRRVRLAPPRPPSGSIARPRLDADLERAADLPLTVLVARAGFGKTTALAAWARTTPRQVAWLSVDEADADLRRFAAHLVAAIRTVAPDAVAGTLDAISLAASPDPILLGESLADDLLNLDGEVVVVVDDLHLAGRAAAEMLAALLRHPGPILRLVVGCRALPDGLDDHRLQALGQATRIGEGQLRLNLEEIEALLGPAHAHDAAEVLRRTDGWPAGVRAVALGDALTVARPPERVQTYLEHDVLRGQPPELVAFLRQVAEVERVSPGLAAAITGNTVAPEEAARLLAEAEARGLFVTRLGNDWWRLHPLLREVLQAARPGPGATVGEADHDGAIRWLVEAGEPDAAVALALRTGREELAADVMADHIRAWFVPGRYESVEIVERLPTSVVARRPELLVARAALQLMRTDSAATVASLRQAMRLLNDRPDDDPVRRALWGEMVYLDTGALYHGGNDPLFTLDDLRALIDLPPDGDLGVALAGSVWGLRMMLAGRWPEAEPAVSAAAARSARAGGALQAWAAWGVAALHMRDAAAAEAASWLDTVDEAARPNSPDGPGLPMWFCNTASQLRLETGDLPEAERLARLGLGSRDPRLLVRRDLAARLARILAATGRHAEGAALLGKERRRMLLAGAMAMLPDLDAAAADVALAAGDPAPARRWADATAVAFPHDPLRTADHPAMAQARAWLASGRSDEAALAARGLEALRDHAAASHDRMSLARALPLLAVAHAAAGDAEAARAAMRAAVEIEPGELTRRFVDAGPGAIPLLREIADGRDNDRTARTARRVLDGLAEPPASPSSAVTDTPAIQSANHHGEALTGRQSEILALMARWMTNKEIAEALGVSAHTVKKHVEHILERLGATDRRDAVTAAVAAGWLDPADAAQPPEPTHDPSGIRVARTHAPR